MDVPVNVDVRKLMRKMDLKIIPWLTFLYTFSFLDRISIGNANLYSLKTDLHLTNSQYLLCLTIFFISYALFEVPSNLILRRLRPSIWLSTLMLMWGVMMMLQGFVSNFGGLMTMRWMLGMFEAGFFPGVTYYLSRWYNRNEIGLRLAIFFSGATISGAFGGLLAAAIANMNGVGGKASWAWIFIIEGLVTIVAGFFSFWIIVDFPEDATFLTEAERAVILEHDSQDKFDADGENLRRKAITASLTDWKTYLYIILLSGVYMPLFALALFLPSIISEVCYEATAANLLTVPVYLLAFVFTCTVGFLADRYDNRGLFNLVCLSIAATGYIILISSRSAALSYVAVYLAACGIYPCIPNSAAWAAKNIQGTYKRSISIAIIITVGNIQGAVSSNVYRANQAPWYPMGHGLVLMYLSFGLISTAALRVLLKAENARRERGERDEAIEGYGKGLEKNGKFESVDEAKKEKGDAWSGYRYVL